MNFQFRNQKMFYDTYWKDEDTFIFQFGDGIFRDEEGDDYFFLIKYHKDEDRWITFVCYEDEHILLGRGISAPYLTPTEKHDLIEFAKTCM